MRWTCGLERRKDEIFILPNCTVCTALYMLLLPNAKLLRNSALDHEDQRADKCWNGGAVIK